MTDDRNRKLAWLRLRQKMITSTDLASIMGLPGAYGSPMAVYLSKRNPIEDDELDTPEYMVWGNRLQEAILGGYAAKMSADIELADPYKLVVVRGHPDIGASLDAWRKDDNAPVDAKNVGHRDPTEWGEDLSSDIPAKFVVQLTVQMLCQGTKYADLAALFGGRKLGVYRVELDPEVAAGIIEAGERFYRDHVLADVPPPVDASPEWTRFLASRRQSTQRILTATPDMVEHLQVLARARAERTTVEELIAERENLVKAFIAENEGLEAPGFRVTYKARKDSQSVDWENVAKAVGAQMNPGMFDAIVRQHTKTKPGARVFLFKQKGDKNE